MRTTCLAFSLVLMGCTQAPAAADGDNAANRAAASPGTPAAGPAAAAAYLPRAGSHASRTMIPMVPRADAALSARMAEAVARNGKWFRAWVVEHADVDGPLPYHPNFGLTEAEYRRLLPLLSGGGTLIEVERGSFTVTAVPGGGFRLGAGGRAAALDGIVVYPEAGYAQTPWGRLENREDVDQRDPTRAAGRWRGVGWENGGEGVRPTERIFFGRSETHGRMIILDIGEDPPIYLLYN
jgi:hypothetical protein